MLATLPIACLAFLFLAIRRSRPQDWRTALLLAAVAWGVLLTAITEILSALRLLELRDLATAWAMALVPFAACCLVAKARMKVPPPPRRPPMLSTFERSLLSGIIFVILCTGIIAWVAPPNTSDSMIYHLSRVMHWMQNRSVAFYPTHIPRQLYQAPWSEFGVLQFRVLGGDDRLANFVQWLAMVGSLVGVSLLSRMLGAGIRGQILATVACVAIPMGILQSTSTQTDYVAAFWLVCLAYFTLTIRSQIRRVDCFGAGAALGLAVLTKATAYLFAFPFVAWLAWTAIRQRSGRASLLLAFVPFMALAINSGHYLRTFELYGTPLGPGNEGPDYVYANDTFTIGATMSNLLRNLGLHLGTPLPGLNSKIENSIDVVHQMIGVAVNDTRTTWHKTEFHVPQISFDEDQAGNPVQLMLIVASLLLYGFQSKTPERTGYAFALCAGYVMFCAYLKWQPWNSRLHLPLFVLWTPFIGLALSSMRRVWLANTLTLLAFASALPWVGFNTSKPLLGEGSIFAQSRSAQYFRAHPAWYGPFTEAAKLLGKQNCRDIGFDVPGNWYPLFEYPAWVLLGQAVEGDMHMEHVNVTNLSNRALPEIVIDPTWRPCALFTMSRDAPATIGVGGQMYQKVWTSSPVSIYAADRIQEPPNVEIGDPR